MPTPAEIRRAVWDAAQRERSPENVGDLDLDPVEAALCDLVPGAASFFVVGPREQVQAQRDALRPAVEREVWILRETAPDPDDYADEAAGLADKCWRVSGIVTWEAVRAFANREPTYLLMLAVERAWSEIAAEAGE